MQRFRFELNIDGREPADSPNHASQIAPPAQPANKNGPANLEWQAFLLHEISCDHLAEVLKRLKPAEKCLLQLWLHFGRDKDVARELEISPSAAKLRRERLFRRIKRECNTR